MRDQDADGTVAQDQRHPESRPRLHSADDGLVDLAVVDHRVDALASPALQHAGGLRTIPRERHADVLIRLVACRGLDHRVAVGLGHGEEDDPGVDQVAEPADDELEQLRGSISVERRFRPR